MPSQSQTKNTFSAQTMIHSHNFVTESSADLTLILTFFGACFPMFWTLFCVLVRCQLSVSDVMARILKLSFAFRSQKKYVWFSSCHYFCFLFFTLQCLSLWSELLIKYCSILEKGWSVELTPSYFSLNVIG